MDAMFSSNATVVFAFWLGVAVVAVTLGMLLLILLMRRKLLRRERRHAAAAAFWGAVLASDDPPSRKLVRADVSGFVSAWVEQANASPERLPRLREVATQLGLERHLLNDLTRGTFHERIASVTALGLLGNRAHFARIEEYLEDPSPILSLSAARSLMHLHPVRAVALFVPQITRRDDWTRGRVATILRGADEATVSDELAAATLRANADMAPRLVRFLATVSPKRAASVIRQILVTSADDHLVSTCLQVMTNPDDLDVVRGLLGHPRWHVRLHAAAALGRLGGPEDEAPLTVLLADEQWWVRYRAAQALGELASVGEAGLKRLFASQTDRFARDILGHVLAEKHLGEAA